jgi:hypothetical protein
MQGFVDTLKTPGIQYVCVRALGGTRRGRGLSSSTSRSTSSNKGLHRMDRGIPAATIAEIELALSHVSEIRAARIVSSDEGVIQEIHVLADPSKSPKQLVRDIESTIMAQFGIPIDHRTVSIAQLGRDSIVNDEPHAGPARARIHSVHTDVVGVRAVATVSLELEGEMYTGTAEGPASTTGRRRLIGQATLNAVEMYANGTFSFALEDVAIVTLGRERVAVSCVILVSPLGEQALAGSALERQSENDSLVRATLDAINRRLGFLTTTYSRTNT